MKKGMALLSVVVLVSVMSVCQGWGIEGNKPRISLSTRFVSKYIWRGFDKFDDGGAVQPSIDLGWPGTGFSSTVWSCWALSSGSEDQEEMDYITTYSGSFLKDTPCATDYSVNWTCYDYPNIGSKYKDMQEIGAGFSWPNLIVIGGNPLVPSYYVGGLWPAKSDAVNRKTGGWVHILGLGYDLSVSDLLIEGRIQMINLSAEMVYNGGMGGDRIDHDWSHVVLGASTSIAVGDIAIRPELNYQISMDDSVNEENELWCGLSISYSF